MKAGDIVKVVRGSLPRGATCFVRSVTNTGLIEVEKGRFYSPYNFVPVRPQKKGETVRYKNGIHKVVDISPWEATLSNGKRVSLCELTCCVEEPWADKSLPRGWSSGDVMAVVERCLPGVILEGTQLQGSWVPENSGLVWTGERWVLRLGETFASHKDLEEVCKLAMEKFLPLPKEEPKILHFDPTDIPWAWK